MGMIPSESILSEQLEQLVITVHPTAKETFRIEWSRTAYWQGDVIDRDSIDDVDLEYLAHELFHLVMPWAPMQIIHGRQIDSPGSQ